MQRRYAPSFSLHDATAPFQLMYFDRYVEAARSQMDEVAWQRAWEVGRAMPLEEAVEYALASAEHRTLAV